MERLRQLYCALYGVPPLEVRALPQAGSNRMYYRLTGNGDETQPSVIGVVGKSVDENRAFIYLTRHFTLRQLPVPQLLAVSPDECCYLQSDLGSTSLYTALEKGRRMGGRYTLEEQRLLRRTIEALPNLQIRGARGLDFSRCYPQEAFDKTSALFDLNYFKYCFLKALDIDFHELKLEASFQLMAKDLAEDTGEAFLYRDFQARNVMLSLDGTPYFIDYQGGRRGPVEYDVASFLWQASAQYSPRLREDLVDAYLRSLRQYTEVDGTRFRERLKLFVLFRMLQVLGAYGFRGYYERKQYFIQSIPYAITNLRLLLNDGGCPYPYLRDLLGKMVNLPQLQPQAAEPARREDGYRVAEHNIYTPHSADGPATYSKYDGKGRLHVRVFSFSFHKGIPEDTSGNGGGYVFDCRSTHNPGRYEPYKNLTGRDEPVIRFLEDDGEIVTFLESVYRLADAHVARFMQRGFTDLMFSFGCTGGQHRSVYCAQHLAEHIHQKYGIEVSLLHREQHISEHFPAKEAMVEQDIPQTATAPNLMER